VNTSTKLLAFAAVVALMFGAAAAVGDAVGPIEVGSDRPTHNTQSSGGAASGDLPRGLAIAQDGRRLAVDTADIAADTPSPFGFAIVDDDDVPVTAFDELHERALHLIVLSRNLVDYLHLHPTMDAGGHWTVDMPALAPGSYRVFADFRPTGSANLTLATDVSVAGDVHPLGLPAPNDLATVDGYTVTMDGSPAIGDSELSFSVELAGQVVRTDPYLGAAGHLVAIRSGDLAYLHVHPHEGGTPIVTFTGEFPTAGTYRLFFDFSHDGIVRTAAFTVIVGPALDDVPTTVSHEEGH